MGIVLVKLRSIALASLVFRPTVLSYSKPQSGLGTFNCQSASGKPLPYTFLSSAITRLLNKVSRVI